MHQFLDADVVSPGGETNGNQMAFAQRFLKRRMKLVRRDFTLVQIDRHQFFINFHHLIDDRGVIFGHLTQIARAGGILEAIDDTLAAVDRKIDRPAD